MSKLRKAAARALPRKYKNKLRNAVHPAQRLALARMLSRGESDVGLLSVVIPAYNVAEYIAECLTSVISQSYTNLEIIVVDDGSTDASMQIVAGFAKYDKRISVIQLENGGNGRARNIGINVAKGEYLTFADSDDVVAPGAYALMMTAIKTSGSDFVVGSSMRLIGKKLQSTKISSHMHAKERTGISINDFPDILDDVFLWNKVFKKSFWDARVAPIPEGVLYEDQETTARAFVRAHSFDVLEEIVYFWRQRSDGSSITQGKRSQKDLEDRIAVAHSVTRMIAAEANVDVLVKWYTRLFGSDLVPYYEQVPYTSENYWTVLQAGISSLAQMLADDITDEAVFLQEINFHSRVLLHLIYTDRKPEVIQVIVDRMEAGGGLEIVIEDGKLTALPNYYPALKKQLSGVSLECSPAAFELVSDVSIQRRPTGAEIELTGHAFLAGFTDHAGSVEIELMVMNESKTWIELEVRHKYDVHLDAKVNDAFASHGHAAFLAELPIELWTMETKGLLQFSLSRTINGYRYVNQHRLAVPAGSAKQQIDTRLPLVCDYTVDERKERFSIDVDWGKRGSRAVPYLSTSKHRIDPTEIQPIGDNHYRYIFVLAQNYWGRRVSAPHSGAYTFRVDHVSGSNDGDTSITLPVSEKLLDLLPMDSELSRANIFGFVTANEHFAVKIGPPLTVRERSRYRQRQLQRVFRFMEEVPVKQHVVFESFGGNACTDSPLALSDELHRTYPSLQIYWSIVDFSVGYPEYAEPLLKGTSSWYKIVTSARLLVNNQNFPHYFRKNPAQKYLQTWHGTPLKRIGFDVPVHTVSALYREALEREAASWDAIIVQNDFSAVVLPKSLGHTGDIINVGYPRNDCLLSESADTVRTNTRALFHASTDDLVILYAPTWRDTQKDHRNQLLPVASLDIDLLLSNMPTGTKLLLRSHHNIELKATHYASDAVVDVSDYPQINDLMLSSDVLITDYSSIMFDYSVMSKPVIYFAPDLTDYRDFTRGFYLDYEDIAKEMLCTTTKEVIDLLSVSEDSQWLRPSVVGYWGSASIIREQYAKLDDGHSSRRVVDYLCATNIIGSSTMLG